MRLPVALTITIAALLGCGSATSATAAPPERAVYLALGDSVAAGIGAGPGGGYVDQVAADLTAQRDCGRGQALGCSLELVNLSDPGATTASIVGGGQLAEAVALIEAREATPAPVDDVRLVTLTVGGNDLVNPVVAACLGGPSARCVGTINAQLQQVSTGLDQILQSLRDAGGSDLTIAVTTYYNSFVPPCRYAALGGLAQVVLEGPVPGGLFPAGLNGIIRAEAQEVGARVVETGGLIGPEQLVGDCLHPNGAGHTAIAGAVGSALGDVALTHPASGR